MAKGDDAIRKKLNKANRKKLRKDDRSSSSVTARVASIIAAKKRRQSGKRRKCQVPLQSDVVLPLPLVAFFNSVLCYG